MAAPFSSLSAAERAAGLVDRGTLAELSRSAAGPVWVGAGRIRRIPVTLALTDGHRRGGTVGVSEAGVLSEVAAAAQRDRVAVVMCWDTGGVRVDEGPVALATASAVGVALARLALSDVPVLTVISGPRGCFGAPSVIAALSTKTIITADAHWGLTGPRLLGAEERPVPEEAAWEATSARHRRQAGHADALVADSVAAIRKQIADFLAQPQRRRRLPRVVDRSAAKTAKLMARLDEERAGCEPISRPAKRPSPPQRDLLRFSFRGLWKPTTPILKRGLVHAAWGEVDGRPALGIIVGSDRVRSAGIGIEDASAITEMLRFGVQSPPARGRAPIFIFLFCQGHAVDLLQERAGLHCALAEVLKSLVAARLLGHPILCVLGGAAYGAAYLSLAAPSHRILAIRGTTVAPMAPRVLAAFRRLRGMRSAPDTPPDLAELIPEVRMVDSIIRLPRALREELDAVRAGAPPATHSRPESRRIDF